MSDHDNWYQPPQSQPAPTPYGAPQPFEQQVPPRKKSLNWLWAILGVGGFSFLLCAGCCFGLYQFGSSESAKDINNQLGNHPTVLEQIGTPATVSYNFSGSANHDDMDTYVYDISGPKGSGQLVVEEGAWDADPIEIISAELVMPDGNRFTLK